MPSCMTYCAQQRAQPPKCKLSAREPWHVSIRGYLVRCHSVHTHLDEVSLRHRAPRVHTLSYARARVCTCMCNVCIHIIH